ncbi:MAG TPA: hypothetical protein VGH23_01585 [Rhizomicrobium sp.]|jgi:hypothetical protein
MTNLIDLDTERHVRTPRYITFAALVEALQWATAAAVNGDLAELADALAEIERARQAMLAFNDGVGITPAA